MIQRPSVSTVVGIFVCLVLAGCAGLQANTLDSGTTADLIENLRRDRIEQLYYDDFPAGVKELMVRPNIIPDLIDAYDRGGDDLFRFNLIVILNHRSALSDSDKTDIAGCLGRALSDVSPWTRTEAVWGLGILGVNQMVPGVIPLLDDPEPMVVNEAILALAKLTGMRDLPLSNQDMPAEERMEAIRFWKDWWAEVRPDPI